jgi:hypothetical protein
MSQIRIIEDELNTQYAVLHPCLISLKDSLRHSLEEIDIESAIQQRSESFKKCLSDAFVRSTTVEWSKTSIFENPALNDVPAIFRLDGKAKCSGSCGSIHRLNIVLCLNNREAIGSNFLKLEIAAYEQIRYAEKIAIYEENILGVLLTLDTAVLESGNWDNSYANANEYTFAFKHAYRGNMRSNLTSMQIHSI